MTETEPDRKVDQVYNLLIFTALVKWRSPKFYKRLESGRPVKLDQELLEEFGRLNMGRLSLDQLGDTAAEIAASGIKLRSPKMRETLDEFAREISGQDWQ